MKHNTQSSWSGSIFLSLVLLFGTLYPVFHASARSTDPLQPAATTPSEIADAFDALMAGMTPEEAFLEQPVPYRDFGRTLTYFYSNLFGQNLPVGGDAYRLSTELHDDGLVAESDGRTVVTDLEFSVRLVRMAYVDPFSVDFTESVRQSLQAVDANHFGVIGEISTADWTGHFIGCLYQWDHDETRVRELVILSEITLNEFEHFEGQLVELGLLSGTPPAIIGDPSPALNPYEQCVERARIQREGAKRNADISFNFQLAGITALLFATGILCLANAAVPFMGMIAAALCIKAAAAAATAAAAGALWLMLERKALADSDYATNVAHCCNDFPADCDAAPH